MSSLQSSSAARKMPSSSRAPSGRGGTDSFSNETAIIEDARLSHVIEFAELDEEEKKIIVIKYGINSFESLRLKVDELMAARTSRGDIGGLKRLILRKVVLWYEDYLRVNNQREPDMPIELTRDALMHFELNGFSIPCAKREGLKHVLQVLLGPNVTDIQNNLADHASIFSFDDVMKCRRELENGTLAITVGQSRQGRNTISPKLQKELSQVADWLDDFREKNGLRQPSLKTLKTELTPERFRVFVEENAYRYTIDPEGYYNLIKANIHEKNPSNFLKGLRRDDMRKYTATVEKIMEVSKEDVLTNITPELVDAKVERLDWLIEYWLGKVMNFKSEDSGRRPMVFHGDMQSGKTAVTAVGLMVCYTLKVPTIVVTKGRKEAMELLAKLRDFAPQALKKNIVGLSGRRKVERFVGILESGGAFVLFDSQAQLKKAVTMLEENWEGKQFVAQIDEADTMFRTYDRSQKFEAEYDNMIGLGPIARIYITATPVPVLLALREEKEAGVIDGYDFKSFSSGDDYVGVKDMQTPKDEDGNNVFLTQGELRRNSPIPFTCDKAQSMCLDAAGKKWSLLLNISNPRVYTEDNIFQQASLSQIYVKQELNKDTPVLCVTGREMRYRLSQKHSWEDCEGITRVYDALAKIEGSATESTGDDTDLEGDATVPGVLFDGPIFVFGFAKMRRGISYRSPARVTTHVILQMGTGHSIENVVQTLGRGAFNGRSLLNANGHSSVTVLMSGGDWDMVQAYQKYIAALHQRVTSGEDVEEAMCGAQQVLPADTNYLQFTPRRTGQRSKYKANAFNVMHNPLFAVPRELAEGDLERTKWYADSANVECYRVLYTCCDLWKNKPSEFAPQDVVEACNDIFRDHKIFVTKVKRHIRTIVKDGLVKEEPGENRAQKCYSLNNERCARLDAFISKVEELRDGQRKRHRQC